MIVHKKKVYQRLKKNTQDSGKTLFTERLSPDIHGRKRVKSGLGMFIFQLKPFTCRRNDQSKNKFVVNW